MVIVVEQIEVRVRKHTLRPRRWTPRPRRKQHRAPAPSLECGASAAPRSRRRPAQYLAPPYVGGP
jgi:hypothetical protein